MKLYLLRFYTTFSYYDLVVRMPEMATVSAKIPKEMKDKLDELGISPSELFKKAAKREIEEKEWEKVIHKLDEARPILLKTSREEWVKAIRESRDER